MGAIDRVFRGRRPSQERPVEAIIAGLWKNNEQGVWYDSSDLSTMYQDLAGTTPVYMPGQGQPDPWIGLQLDKRLGLAKGPERLVNGSFDAGATGWGVSGQDATHIAAFGAGTLRYQSDSTTPQLRVDQTAALVVGRWYEVEVAISAWVIGSIKTDSFAQANQVLAAGLGVTRCKVLAINSTFNLTRNTSNVDLTIDSISIRELPGNHRWQGTATSRAVLSARYNLLTKSEDLSDAAVWATQVSGTGSAPVRTKDYAAAPNGSMTATRLQLALNGGAAASDRSGVAQTVSSTTTGAGYGCAIWLKAASADSVGRVVLLRHMAGITYLPCVLTAEWKAFGRVEAAATNYGVVTLELRGTSGGASDSVDMLVWGADLRAANDGVGLPPYQRVVDASNYDTSGFPLYRKPDGVDDWMQTATVDFSATDKLTLAVAVRKTGTSRGMIAELPTAAGGFLLQVDETTGVVQFRSGGSIVAAVSASGQESPVSRVYVGAGDIAGDIASLRVNGARVSTTTTDQGSGAFGSGTVYFDRRGGSTLPFSGRDYGTIIVGRLLTGPEAAAVEKLLRSKSRAY